MGQQGLPAVAPEALRLGAQKVGRPRADLAKGVEQGLTRPVQGLHGQFAGADKVAKAGASAALGPKRIGGPATAIRAESPSRSVTKGAR